MGADLILAASGREGDKQLEFPKLRGARPVSASRFKRGQNKLQKPEIWPDKDTPYEAILNAILYSEDQIKEVFRNNVYQNKSITYADLYGIGIGRRALALSTGFRQMVEQRNSTCAMPMIRMQLDTALRLYAGFWVDDHQVFCKEILGGKQINRYKDSDGKIMQDSYLIGKLLEKNPWISEVYNQSSGYIHFSSRHIHEAITSLGDDGLIQFRIGAEDTQRKPEDFQEPMRCMHHLNHIIATALRDWFVRMYDPQGIGLTLGKVGGDTTDPHIYEDEAK